MVLTVQAGRTKKTLIARDSTTQRVALSCDDSAAGSQVTIKASLMKPGIKLQISVGVCATLAMQGERAETALIAMRVRARFSTQPNPASMVLCDPRQVFCEALRLSMLLCQLGNGPDNAGGMSRKGVDCVR